MAVDPYNQRTIELESPARGGGEILTQSDTALLDPRPRFISIVGTGTLRCEITDGIVLNFTADEVAAFQGIAPFSLTRLHATGTDAALSIRGYL